ncbi:hypothetical protein [Streptomyces sp. 2132.2]|uniref:hypothetical protein n=1 Tax=Streptomyces sp. 2132.2 TaxID=2485161 RepID=UPI001611FF93|nr:hypothetical protein [Streptomyces sp. 2132.2]
MKNGWYLPATTWREILKVATEVGRDITPNLTRLPQPASSELVAPLYAYLGTHAADTKHTLPATPRPGSTSAADPLPGRVDRLRAAGARRRRDLAGHGGADPGARSADRAPP